MAKTVVGLYDQFDQAQEVVRDLVSAGIERENISMVASDSKGEYAGRLKNDAANQEGAATGAGVGAVTGGIAGLLVGLGALAIPGIGPVLAAGPLVAALGGAGIGAVTGGIAGALTDAGIAEADADIYSEGVRRGGTLVTVYATNEQADLVADVMNRYHPVDVQKRAEMWRQGNWNTFDEGAEPFAFDRTRLENDQASRNAPGRIGETDLNETQLYGDMESGIIPDENSGYHFGYRLARDQRFQNQSWQAVKADLRKLWEEQHPGLLWDEHEEAVNEGWLAGREK